MQNRPGGANSPEPTLGRSGQSLDSVTRGFLFSDLRAYTDYVETHGAASAASLLDRYRALVREAIRRFGGAEIKTEGDSFYVVFSSVSSAVRCGLVISANATADAAGHPDEAIRVGIGIHAGETIETAEGYVGSPVNIAARICSQAGPNEVLVSETVRALTRTMIPVRFEARGRRQLKGIAEPIALFAVVEAAPGAVPWAEPQRRPVPLARRVLLVGGAAGVAVALAVIVSILFRSTATPGAAALPPGMWKIGLDMPLTGGAAFRGVPVRNAVQLAIADANKAGGIDGSHIALGVFDDGGATPNGQDNNKGADNARTMAADPMTLAMVGPWGSSVGAVVIPVTNKAGLFECSPSNTDPLLTRPPDALQLRKAHPDKINYVRLAPRDDIQALALASFAYHDLNARVALVVDDADFGREIADEFQAAYTSLGGQVVRSALKAGADPMTVLAPLSAKANAPSLVFFGGFTDTGATAVRKAMQASGHGAIPLLSWDGLSGSGAEDGSYIKSVGPDAAVGSYISHASVPLPTASFAESYRRAYDVEPDEYAAAGYACVQVIVDSLREVAKSRPTAGTIREALRAYATDPTHRFDTAIGDVRFDANGDPVHQFVTFYRVDPSAAGKKGDWVIFKQQDFGPAP
jgi:branched-chain amino acid transport system substrate-binding protein